MKRLNFLPAYFFLFSLALSASGSDDRISLKKGGSAEELKALIPTVVESEESIREQFGTELFELRNRYLEVADLMKALFGIPVKRRTEIINDRLLKDGVEIIIRYQKERQLYFKKKGENLLLLEDLRPVSQANLADLKGAWIEYQSIRSQKTVDAIEMSEKAYFLSYELSRFRVATALFQVLDLSAYSPFNRFKIEAQYRGAIADFQEIIGKIGIQYPDFIRQYEIELNAGSFERLSADHNMELEDLIKKLHGSGSRCVTGVRE
ncbi:MAG: hypothetical protein KDD61_04935 [Bdellovibrionales bacterium]|nr:hypothetical protein [Bdellovibrionales bacterium]